MSCSQVPLIQWSLYIRGLLLFPYAKKRKMLEILNVIEEIVGVQRATTELWMRLGGLLSTHEARVTLTYHLVRLLRFFRA